MKYFIAFEQNVERSCKLFPFLSGEKLITQTEMTCPRDIVEEGECGRDLMTDVELGLSCLHLSPECEQFYPCIMDESPGDSRL